VLQLVGWPDYQSKEEVEKFIGRQKYISLSTVTAQLHYKCK
jgi:hypothetical protein